MTALVAHLLYARHRVFTSAHSVVFMDVFRWLPHCASVSSPRGGMMSRESKCAGRLMLNSGCGAQHRLAPNSLEDEEEVDMICISQRETESGGDTEVRPLHGEERTMVYHRWR